MSPIYIFGCEQCSTRVEKIQGIGADNPVCERCGGAMAKVPAPPAIIRMFHAGGFPIRSKGYKEGYSKEYLKDNPSS